jgi:hypothetical protein
MTAETLAARETANPEAPAVVPLYVYRGDSRSWAFRLWEDDERTVPYNLAQVQSVAAQIRRAPDDRAAVDLVCAITLPNWVFVHLSAGQSQTTPTGRWDLQLTWGPVVRVLTVIRGPVTVEPDVTR